ncbi:uncharacterized protein LOC110271854 isoform X2 [Arachis ipaensis]|uniref:uncharacterized protein LOC110271854 isoform X2 n=1 Tax=Arachis ipaensis TaxID=130454 RepID=UPI000A2B2158|nr:uncharacterized protein LOC110271854 isoform X2 [Arachis ipaensis]
MNLDSNVSISREGENHIQHDNTASSVKKSAVDQCKKSSLLIDDSSMADAEEIEWDPMFCSLPFDDKEQSKEASEKNPILVATPTKMSWTPTQTPKSGNVTTGEASSNSKKSRSAKLVSHEWIQNYEVISKPRSQGGRVDKFYHHKYTGMKFRSLKEVERYENYGILPGPRRKTQDIENPKTHADEEMVGIEVKETKTKYKKQESSEEDFIDIIKKADKEERKRMVEDFLREASYNLMHSFDDSPDASSSIC